MKKPIFGKNGVQDIYTARIKISQAEYFKYYGKPMQTLYRILRSDERILWRRVWYKESDDPDAEIRVIIKCKRKVAHDVVKKFRNSIFPVPLKDVLFL